MSTLSGFGLLLRWRAAQLKSVIPMAIAIQLMVGAGLVIGDALLVPHLTDGVAVYLATGAATLALVSVGLTLGPQLVAQARLSGLHDYLAAVPLPSLTYLFAELAVVLTIALPGVVAATVLAALRFGIALDPTVAVIPAVLLVALVATATGYALGLGVKNPNSAALLSNALLFFVLLFTPIHYPIDRLPGWLAGAEKVLPFVHMGDLMRHSLTGDGALVTPLLIVAAWGAAGVALCMRLATPRD